MSLIHRIFRHSDTLVCGACERTLEGHREADCARKMSRRWFLGATLVAVAGVVVAPALPQALSVVTAFDSPVVPGSEAIVVSRYLYRIPIQIYRGGNFRKYNADSGDLGTGASQGMRYEIVDGNDPRVTPDMEPLKL